MSRVMIVCPVTERLVPTRYEAEPGRAFRRRLPESGSVVCDACTRRHAWFRAETLLEGQPRPKTRLEVEPRSTQPRWVLRHVDGMGRR